MTLHVRTPQFTKITTYLAKLARTDHLPILNRYGKIGVKRLSEETPMDTGETSMAWSYKIQKTSQGYKLAWTNSKMTPSGDPLVILLEFGHGTRNGGYIPGRNFIRPTTAEVIKKLNRELNREIRR